MSCRSFPSFLFSFFCVTLYREQHQTEMSAIEDKVKWLELELEKTKRSSNENTVQFQSKVGSLKILFLGRHFSHFNDMKKRIYKLLCLLDHHSEGFNPALYFVLTLTFPELLKVILVFFV